MQLHTTPQAKTNAGTTLRSSPALSRVHHNLHDLIISFLEGYTKVHGRSYSLEAFQYVLGEKLDDRYSMLLTVQAKDLDQGENTPLVLTLHVSNGEEYL